MITKQDILSSYLEKCKDLNQPIHQGLRTQYEQQISIHQLERENSQEFEETDDMSNADLIYIGNLKNNFNHRISDEALLSICFTLESYAAFMQHIDLRYNHLSCAGVVTLSSKLLSEAVNLKTLNLQANSIGPRGAESLSNSLTNHQALLYVNLNGNVIEKRGAIHVIKFVLTCPTLIELDVGNNQINHDGIIAITTALNRANFTLETLNIENPTFNSVMQETAIHLAKMLAINTSLQKLSLKKYRLRCDGMFTLSQHLLENNVLRVLDISCNEISADGAEALAVYLANPNCVLESLNISSNRLVDLGAKAMAQAISQNNTLIHIDLTNNNIQNEGLSRLAEALFHNTTMLSFKLFGNHFDQECLKLFHRLFQTPRTNEWYPDFTTYYVDEQVQMAYIETQVPYDIYV